MLLAILKIKLASTDRWKSQLSGSIPPLLVFEFPQVNFACVSGNSLRLGCWIVNLSLNTVETKINNTHNCDRNYLYQFWFSAIYASVLVLGVSGLCSLKISVNVLPIPHRFILAKRKHCETQCRYNYGSRWRKIGILARSCDRRSLLLVRLAFR